MNEFTIYKHQNSFEHELKRLKNSTLSPKTKKQIEDFAKIRLAKGSTKLRVVKCMYCLRLLAQWLGKDFSTLSNSLSLSNQCAKTSILVCFLYKAKNARHIESGVLHIDFKGPESIVHSRV